MPTETQFLGTKLRLSNRHELLLAIDGATEKNRVTIATPNPEFLELARRNKQFRRALEGMTHCIIDGYGLHLMLSLSKKLQKETHILEHYQGANLVDDLFLRYQKGEKSFYLMGGFPGSAEKLKQILEKKYPHIRIVGAERGEEFSTYELKISDTQLAAIRKAKPDILLVGFGAPKQEIWISECREHIPVMIGVGGTFNFYTSKKRAPKLIQSLKLEWLYRAFTEKGHYKRAWRATVVFSFVSLVYLLRKRASRQK